MTGTKLVHVPFKGISEALSKLIAGRVQLAMSITRQHLSQQETQFETVNISQSLKLRR